MGTTGTLLASMLMLSVLSGCEDPPRPRAPPMAWGQAAPGPMVPAPVAVPPPPCNSEQDCAYAYQQAVAIARNCHMATRTGYGMPRAGTCPNEDAATQAAGQRLAWFRQQTQQQAVVAGQTRAEAVREKIAAQHAQADAAQAAAQQRMEEEQKARQSARDEAQRKRDEAEWIVIDVKGCSERGDQRACDALRFFITGHPESAHQAEAATALQAGRDKIAAVEAKEAEKARKDAQRRTVSRPAPSAAPPPPPDTSAHVCCCDGTVSPECVTPHAGCCDGHGGPCACK